MKQQNSSYRGKIISTFILSLLCTMGAGCASLQARLEQCDSVMSKPLAPGQARVCFAREASMLGAIVSHYVIDCGSNIDFDSKVIEEGQIELGDWIDRTYRRVTKITETQQVVAANSDRASHVFFLIFPSNVPGEEFTLSPFGYKDENGLLRVIRPNARYVGSVRSGEVIVFDRPAGNMWLKVITPSGDEAFAPNFQIETGKKYLVSYTYSISGIDFSLSESP